MFKKGIYTIEKLEKKYHSFKSRSNKRISITLYETAPDNLKEFILDDFCDPRNTFKRTYSKRFDKFDKKIISILSERLSKRNLHIHDCGVSDGRTSVEFFEKIKQINPNIDFIASDYSPELFIQKHKNITLTLMPDGNLAEILFPPFVFKTCKLEKLYRYPINWIVFSLVKKILEKKIKDPNYKNSSEKIRIFCPDALKMEKTYNNFRLSKYNLFDSMNHSYNIIRTMNVLNPTYFSDKEMKIVLKNIHKGLSDDGCWIIGSNKGPDSEVSGAIYTKTQKGFSLFHKESSLPAIHNTISLFNA